MLSAKGLPLPRMPKAPRPTHRFSAQRNADHPQSGRRDPQPGLFNIWVAGNGAGWSNGLHQLTMDTLWFIDPDAGIEGPRRVYNSLADGPWEYNADFTEMTVKLRKGILWSDGVEFTADDVVYTVEKQIDDARLRPGAAPFSTQVAEVDSARQLHRALQAQGAELALPRAVLGALERGLDHAQARVRKGRGRS